MVIIMLITRARMLLNKTVFEAEVLIQGKYTVYAGILDTAWNDALEVADFEFADYYDYLRIFNVPYASSGHGDNDEGESFRNDNLSEAERKEIYELCKSCLKEVWQNDRTVIKAGEWNDGQWQSFSSQPSNSTDQLLR